MKIIYKRGDATLPKENGKIMIGHVVNNVGAWGAGFVIPLAMRYPESKKAYKEWFENGYYNIGQRQLHFRLGQFQSVKINDNLYIANILAQSGVNHVDWLYPFRHECFAEALLKLNYYLKQNKFDRFVCPRVGAGLGGGDWKKIEKIIEKCLSIQAVVYDIDENDWPGTVYSL